MCTISVVRYGHTDAHYNMVVAVWFTYGCIAGNGWLGSGWHAHPAEWRPALLCSNLIELWTCDCNRQGGCWEDAVMGCCIARFGCA